MSLKIGGADPTKIMVGGVSATKVMIGTGTNAIQAWTAARRVIISTRSTNTEWMYTGATGNTEILSLTTYSNIRFSVPVKCDRGVSGWTAGVTIPAEANITALVKDTTYTFTEVV